MNSTVKSETLQENNKPCAKVPTSPSKIPISPTRKNLVHLQNSSTHNLQNNTNDANLPNEDNGNNENKNVVCNSTVMHENSAQQQTKQEISEKNNCRPSFCSSANCSSSSSIQHNSRFKGHQANNLVNLRFNQGDGHKSHRSLSPPGSNVTITSANNSNNSSATNSLNRISLQKLSQGKKAKRIKLYRNGDKFFKGIIYPLSTERIRSFDAFLEDLTRILVDQVSKSIR